MTPTSSKAQENSPKTSSSSKISSSSRLEINIDVDLLPNTSAAHVIFSDNTAIVYAPQETTRISNFGDRDKLVAELTEKYKYVVQHERDKFETKFAPVLSLTTAHANLPAHDVVKLIPECRTYVELFGAVPWFCAKQPSKVEIYNDHLGLNYNLFSMWRDPKAMRVFCLMNRAIEAIDESRAVEFVTDQETHIWFRSFAWFRMVHRFLGAHLEHKQAAGLFPGRNPKTYETFDTNNNPGLAQLYEAMRFADPVLPNIHGRLFRVQYEDYPWQKIVDIYDTPETVFVCDLQKKWFEQSGWESFEQFVTKINKVQGKVALLVHPEYYEMLAPFSRWVHYDTDDEVLVVTK
jgi:hypothetical protein